MVLVGAVAPVAAHEWQTTVTQGPMELGISSSPETPVAGMVTEYSARIQDGEVEEGDPDRLSWGGVTNKTVEVHVNGPGGIHDHVTAEVPADDAHFHFTYLFPTDGSYSLSVVVELEGEEYAFQFQEDVMLLPASASGPEMANLSSSVESVRSDVDSVQGDVEAVESQVSDLQAQVDQLQQELGDHDSALDEHSTGSQTTGDLSQAQGPGFGFTTVLVGVVAVVGFAVGRRF